jgi:hypothetical protein
VLTSWLSTLVKRLGSQILVSNVIGEAKRRRELLDAKVISSDGTVDIDYLYKNIPKVYKYYQSSGINFEQYN